MSGRLVLDASAALEAVLNRACAPRVLDLVEGAAAVYAPDLCAAEVANALWKHARAGDIDREKAHDALGLALALVDDLVPAADLAAEALATSIAHAHPVYDALYAVAAMRSGATVCTLDHRLAALLEALKAPVELIG